MDGRPRRPPAFDRRRLLLAGAAAALPFAAGPFAAASLGDVKFHASWDGKPVGEHRITFRTDGDRMTVDTHVDIALKVMVFKVFRLERDAREVWRAGRLVSLTSETELDGEFRLVSGDAVENGFRIVGADGPYLAAPNLLTTNSLWDSRIVREATLIDVQHGGEVGLAGVAGPALDRMLSRYPGEYEPVTIPGGTYPANPAGVDTFGVRAVVVATSRMPDAVAYAIARSVFGNFDDFRRLHPAFDRLSVAKTVPGQGRALLSPARLVAIAPT